MTWLLTPPFVAEGEACGGMDGARDIYFIPSKNPTSKYQKEEGKEGRIFSELVLSGDTPAWLRFE